MATKSILKNIHIETEPEIEAFVEALEKASNDKSTDDRIIVTETTGEDIKKMFEL